MNFELGRLPWAIPTILLSFCLSVAAGCGTVETEDDDATTETPGDDDTSIVEITPTMTPCADMDGDGYCYEDDCNDADPEIHPGATEVCEQYPDIPFDNDCDGVEACAVDDDNDGYSENDGDCDDTDIAINPGAFEACDGVVDEDCDGVEGNGCSYVDDDGDGQSEDDGDCDDEDPSVFLGADERFDGIDNNCDGEAEQVVVLSPAADVTVNGEAANENLGWSVAGIVPPLGSLSFNGDEYPDVVIGGPGYGGASIKGAAKLVFGSSSLGPQGNAPVPVTLSESQAVARAGMAVSGIGDINLDGYADIAVGAPEYDTNGGADAGKVYVILGHEGEWTSTELSRVANANLPGLQPDDRVGSSLSGGNVNGDYFDDVLVGSVSPESGGYLQVVPGKPEFSGAILVNSLAYLQAPAEMSNMQLGQAIAFVGDTVGDSLADLVVTAPYTDSREGAVIWIPGNIDFSAGMAFHSFDDVSAVVFTGDVAGNNIGWSVSGNGDINGDGNPDFMVGAEANDNQSDPVAMIFLGGDNFMNGAPVAGTYPITDYANIKLYASAPGVCPCSVAMNGDMNGDGYDDILVGTAGGSAAYLILGKEAQPSTMYLELDADYIFRGADENDLTGYAVAWVGSINGDGYDDFVIGAPNADLDVSIVDSGSVYFLFGFSTSSAQ